MRRCAVELLLFCLGCDVNGSIGLGFDPSKQAPVWVDLNVAPHYDIDILFVVENTANMEPKQRSLKTAFRPFATALQKTSPRHFHFGVITTDLGVAKAQGSCVAPGDDGLLLPLGRGAPADCLGPVGARFLDLDQHGADNLPEGQDLEQTLSCMTQVGTSGCGYPQPLEALKRALSNRDNSGFLREDALLIIVLVSDGDDCSAPADSAVFDPARTDYLPFDPLRCVTAGVECGNPPHPPTSGGTEDCAPRNGAGLYDLSRYRDYLFQAGSVKQDPNAVGLVLLAGPAGPISLAMAASPSGNELQPSCVAAGDPNFLAWPAVRLQALAQLTPKSVVTNICTPAASEYALGSLAVDLITPDPGAHCLPAPIANSAKPKCEVYYDTTAVPDCASSSAAGPCWELRDEPSCVPFFNPHDRKDQALALEVRNPAAGSLSARCMVLEAAN